MSLSLSLAFLEQAKTDYSSYNVIRQNREQPSSQWLHLLQMTLEKTAKAYLSAGGAPYDQLRQSHSAFGRFIKVLPRNQAISAKLGGDAKVLRAKLRNVAPLVDEIERLVPRRGYDGPNAEYPWTNPHGEFRVPCRYDFESIVTQIDRPQGRNLLKILEEGLFNGVWHSSLGIK